MKGFRIVLLILLCGIAACDYVPSEDRLATQEEQRIAAWRGEVEAWKARRTEALLEEDSWLTLIGLEWIEKGSNRIGASAKNEIVVRSGNVPDWLGVIVVEKMPGIGEDESDRAVARFVPKPGAEVFHDGRPVEDSIVMKTDHQENTTVLEAGTVQFHLIERGERLGVRIKDSEADARTNFQGLDYYPFDPDLRIEATFVPNEQMIPVGDVTGHVQEILSPGTLQFEIDGQAQSLLLLEGGPERYFVIFSDETSGRETYGAGRYLYMDAADEDGRAVIDFNQSYNPPCTFSDYATCPLPPRQNRLEIPIRAGELMYSAGHQYAGERGA